jgi:predicted metal-dependent peptidase
MKIYSPEEKIMQARLILALDYVFFGSIFFRLNVHEDDTCKTAWTDGHSIGYNLKWLSQWSEIQIIGVFIHEILHVILKHHLRQELNPIYKEQHGKFNRAADYALNPSVLRCPGTDLPPNVCLDLERWPDSLAEEIFPDLPGEGNDTLRGKKGEGTITGTSEDIGEVRPYKKGKATPAERAQVANEVDQWVQAAAMKAQGVGAMTDQTKGFIKKVLAPMVHWQDELQLMVEDMCKDDYTWKRPSTRYTQQGIYMPSMHGEHMPDLVFFIDRSGSLTKHHLTQIMAEVRSIIELFKVRVICVYWNTEYTHHEEFLPEDILSADWGLEVESGGGTNFANCWDWLDEQDEIDPEGIVFFTDFECRDWPMEDPGVPVIWAQVPGFNGSYIRHYDSYMPEYGSRVTIPRVGAE